ncbi:MAG: DUF3800 domain-containing protein [Bacteroidetes bacterium]|nr:DUF3800 domain-containing protein [Bacteroidota bacterium]
MNKKIGFIDESGNKSIHFEKEGVTTFFVVSAVIIEENLVSEIREKFQQIASKFTFAPEVKSNAKAFRDIGDRLKFLQAISELDFRIYSVIVDKRKIFEESGLQFQNSFYKYTNGLLDRELYDYYPFLELISDQHGTEDFMSGFIDYVDKHHRQTDLFKGPSFSFRDSKDEPLIQLADFIAGSVARCYEPSKIDSRNNEILDILHKHILHLREWPEVPLKFFGNIDNEDEQYNQELVDFIFYRINEFFTSNQESQSPEIKNQLVCLNYLIYRFKKNPFSYAYSDEILDRINIREINVTKRVLNKEIITRLRDSKILITSSTSGYKIACCKADITRFYNNYSSKIVPMIETIGKVDTVIKNATSGNLSLLEDGEFKLLRELIETTNSR